MVRTTARERDSNYDIKAFGLEDLSDLTSLLVVPEMETISLPFLAINTSPLPKPEQIPNTCGFCALLSTAQPS